MTGGRVGPFGRSGTLRVTSALAWGLVLSLLTLLPVGSVSAAAAAFDPLPNATAVNNGVYASVVADGAGTFHSVMREDFLDSQSVVYRRSHDGGRSWLPAARWTGESGGGTRPMIAVDGPNVALVFIGGLCEPGSSACGEAPYLVRSSDAGVSFSAPLRLHNNAFHVSVGVDGPRTWVAWQGRDVQNRDLVFIRGYGADGKAFAERRVPGVRPLVVAGGGGGVITFVRQGVGDGEEGQLFSRAQLLDGAGFGAVDELPLDGAPNHSLPVDAASAAGHVHLLYRASPFGSSSFFVRSGAVGSQLGDPVPVITGTGGSIAARPGLVAVSAVDPGTGVTSVVRSDDGTVFSAPVQVAVTEGGAYRTDLGVAAVPGSLVASSTVGDLLVTTSGQGEMTVAAAREETCTVPETCDPIVALWQRRVDALTSGSGYVSAGGRPAVDGVSAVIGWTQLSQGSVLSWRSMLAQAAVAENVGVAEVSFTQGAKGAATLVVERPTKVLATFSSTLAGPTTVKVTTVVTDVADGSQVLRVTDSVRLEGGREPRGLPASAQATFAPLEGHEYVASVTVSDPASAAPSDAGDNELTTAPEDFPALARTRDLNVLFLPLSTTKSVVDCGALRDRVVTPGAPLASAMLPVYAAVRAEIGCSPADAVDHNPDIDYQPAVAAKTLTELDYFAHLMGRDAVVAVAPKGWLERVTGVAGIVGLATVSGRGAIVDVEGRAETFAHELTHNLGLSHVTESASGLWVARNQFRSGWDYMIEADTPDTREWVSAKTWDALVGGIGGPDRTPQPPREGDGFVYVQGTAYFDRANNRWESGRTSMQLVATAPKRTSDPNVPTIDMVVRQVDGQDVIDEEPVLISPIAGAGAADQSPAGDTYPFSAYAELKPGAVELQVVLDGTVVETRPLNDPPVISAVTGPTSGAGFGRGADLEVQWDASDPNGDPLTTDLLVSGDGGNTWEPLAADVGSSPATATVPADLDGDQVKVRVIVSDGVRMATADSEEFSVGSSASEVRDRVAFTRNGNVVSLPPRLHLMDPDGEAQYALPLPTTQDWSGSPQQDANDNPIGYQCTYGNADGSCAPGYLDPAWSSDGKRLYFSSDLIKAEFGGAAQPGVLDRIGTHLWSIAADGTDLKRVTAPQTSPQTVTPAPYTVTNRCVDAGSNRIVWFGTGSVYDGFTYTAGPRESIWAAAADGEDQRRVFGWDVASRTNQAAWPRFDGAGWEGPTEANSVSIRLAEPVQAEGIPGSCPRISPDGTQVAFPALVTRVFPSAELAAQAVLVVGIDGSGLRVVTDRDGRNPNDDLFAVDWSDDSTLVVTRREPRGSTFTPCTLYSYSSRPYDLSTQTPTKGTSTPVQNECAAPAHRRVNPDGLLYGELASEQRLADWNMGVLDPQAAGGLRRVGSDTDYDTQFAWGRQVIGASGPNLPLVTPPVFEVPKADAGGPYAATAAVPVVLSAGGTVLAGDASASVDWDLDGDDAFDDARGRSPEVMFAKAGTVPIRVRVTPSSGAPVTSDPSNVVVAAALRLAFEVDPSAEDSPVVATPGPVDLRVEIPAGQPSGVRLGSEDGPPVPWVVVGFDEETLSVRSGAGTSAGSGLPTAGATGMVEVTAADDFRGTTRLTYAHPDDVSRTATVEVVVTGDGGGTNQPSSPPPTVTPPQVPPTVTPPQVLAPVATASAKGRVYFAYKSVKLSKGQKRKLRRLIARIPDGATVVLTRSVGIVKAKGPSGADRKRALKRATVVRDYLLANSLSGPTQVSNGGRTTGKSAKARRVNVTIRYTLPR